MSDARAIEAVTETMRSIVDAGVKRVSAGARAIAAPPHEVAASQDQRVNLFLYRTQIDGSLRNTDPLSATAGEWGRPALPLVLHYLLTPYAPDGNDLLAHRLLGGALQALHSHERLTSRDLAILAPFSDVTRQIEHIRISWQPLDDKDMYSLWSVFQAPYRISAAFEVRAVQIDSRMRGEAPLPVLRRGPDGRGPSVAANVDLAELTKAVAVLGQPAPQIGETVVLEGRALAADTVTVVLTHPYLSAPLIVTPDEATVNKVSFTLPTTMLAGLGAVSLTLESPAGSLVSNQLPLPVAPTITSPLPMTVARTGTTAKITLSCRPDIMVGQDVVLLLGTRSTPADPISAATDTVSFTITAVQPSTFPLRLRIGGVDSRLVADRSATTASFNPDMRVTLT